MGMFGNNKQNNEELNSFIAGIFNEFFTKSNPEQIRTQLTETLLTKKGRTNNKIEYAENLINNITYLIEIQKEWMKLIEEYLLKGNASSSQLNNQSPLIINKVKQIVPQLSIKYKASYEKYSNIDERIDNLEFDYKYNFLCNNFISLFLNTLVNNRHIYDQLKQNNATTVKELVIQYSVAYTNMFLKNIVGQR